MGYRPKMAVTGPDKSVIDYGGETRVPHYNPALAWGNKWSWRRQRIKVKPSWVKIVCSRSIVDYHSYRKKGCYISSALVEKTIDLLVCRRLKLRGQNWGQQGADHLLVFRQMMLNVQWSNYWPERKTAGVSHSHTISHAYIMTDK